MGQDAWIGKEIDGRYRILERIGAGGMGTVYRAQHLVLGSEVAFKVMNPSLGGTPDSRERFIREAKTCTMLVHKNIVQVRDVGIMDSFLYLTMDYCRGRTLDALLKTEGRLDESRATRLMKQILSAMKEAHGRGIVHRDLKPANIMIEKTSEGEMVRVLDFGLAKWMGGTGQADTLTGSGLAVGTLPYMSPEQLAGDPIDGTSDIYAASAIFYQLLAGSRPLSADSNQSLMRMIMAEPPPPLSPGICSEPIRELIMRGLAKDRKDRPQSAAEFLDKIESSGATAAVNETVMMPQTMQMPAEPAANVVVPRPRPVRPQRTMAPLFLFLFILIVGGGAAGAWLLLQDEESVEFRELMEAGQIAMAGGDWEEAIRQFEEARILLDKPKIRVHLKRARLELALERGKEAADTEDWKTAVVEYKKALDLKNSPAIKDRLKKAEEQLEKYDAAKAFARASQELKAALRTKDWEAVRVAAKKVLVAKPDDPDAPGHLKKARSEIDYKAAMKAAADFHKAGKLLDARKKYQEALAAKPGDKDASRGVEETGTLKVGPKDTYKTINAAVKAAPEGSIIAIASGTYRESVVLDKPLTLKSTRSLGKVVIEISDGNPVQINSDSRIEGLTIRALKKVKTAVSAVRVKAGNATILNCRIFSQSRSGITVEGSRASAVIRGTHVSGSPEAGIFINDKAKATIEDCDLYDNAMSGIRVSKESSATVRNTRGYRNTIAGITFDSKSYGTVENSAFHDNKKPGLRITTGASPVFRNCRLYQNGSGGIEVYSSGLGTIEKCQVYKNAWSGVLIGFKGAPKVSDCDVYDNGECAFLFYEEGKGTIDNCRIRDSKMSAVEIRTKADPVIQNCTVTNGKSYGIRVHQNGVGDIRNTKVSGHTLSGAHVTGSSPTFRLCHFFDNKIKGMYFTGGGRALVEGCRVYGNTQSGVGVENAADPVFSDCFFTDNKQNGALVTVSGKGSFRKCTFNKNLYAGIEVAKKGNPSLSGCSMTENKTAGILVQSEGLGVFSDCTSISNKEYGLLSRTKGSPTLKKCTLSTNAIGARIFDYSPARLENCTVGDNTMSGIVVGKGSNPAITGGTVFNNKQDGVLFFDNALGTITGVTIRDNKFAGVELRDGADPVVQRCTIRGNREGVWAQNPSKGRVENCTLSGNTNGSFRIDTGAGLRKSGNR